LLGLVYRDTNKIDDAIEALQHAIKISPSLTPAREELADLFRSQGRPAEEMAELQDLAALDRNDDRQVAIAMAAARRGQFDFALGALSDVSPKAADAAHVQLARGRVYLARAERTLDRQWARKAHEVLEIALSGGARASEGLALYGRALFLLGEPAAAERILRDAVTTSPIDPEALDYLADASERLGHAVDARDALVSLDALEGDTAAAGVRGPRARRIGVLSLQANDPKRAADYLDQALDAGDTDASTLGFLADAYWRLGSYDVARATLTKALQQEPRNAELLRLGRTIK
jgi:predicted Zn-dependent protease